VSRPMCAASKSSPETYALTTAMRFCVSVPVLSVQITVAQPSASTLGRWRMSTLRFAMRCDAIASARVTVGSSPSGTFATRMPMPNRKLCQNGIPQGGAEQEEQVTPSADATIASVRETRTISRWSGESAGPVLCVRCAILPSSVVMPVAVTTARPWPATTEVPAKIMLARVRRCPARRGLASAVR
jgi:hypothetical protein